MPGVINSVDKEFRLTSEDFQYLSGLVRQNSGINLTEEKRELVYSRVARRLRLLGLTNFTDYCELLRQDSTDEVTQFINSITTNVTSFFREEHHFEYLADRIIPEIIKRNTGNTRPRLRIWSAGCSTGEEPYSIAMVLRESIKDIDAWDAKILATDLDSNVLETARAGEYSIERIRNISAKRRKSWLLMGTGSNNGSIKVRPEIQKLVYFKQLNLTQTWPVHGPFDCIFFRNVAIYFKRETQVSMLNRFADLLHDDGTLFVGHAESLIGVPGRFEHMGLTIHKKVTS